MLSKSFSALLILILFGISFDSTPVKYEMPKSETNISIDSLKSQLNIQNKKLDKSLFLEKSKVNNIKKFIN